MKDERLYLVHILECIERIESFTADGLEAFEKDIKAQDAVLRNLQVLAESAKRLSHTTRGQHSEVDWRGIAGMRNVLVHDYLGVKMERVWEIVSRDLAVLKGAVQDLLGYPEPT